MRVIRSSKLKYLLVAIVLSVFFVPTILWSQENNIAETKADENFADKDIKVGLVLSGGGAKGLAHIGALKVIEEAGVRIDYIGGTSIGAIVGALYASGYTASELDSIFRTVDFDAFIQDELPRDAKTFYEREDSEKYAITLPFDKFKIGLPKGLSKGQNFYNQFSRFTSHVNDVQDFNKLPIPFFCMSTNIETGEQIILDKGYLPEAVAASGALPSVFSPIELNGVLMTDGGVANNYPVKEIREKGAEVVIGIDVQDSLMSRDQLNSVTNIMLQISNFRTYNAMKDKAAETDIYIKPSIKGFTVLSFDQADQLITNGEKAAFSNFEKLRAIADKQKPFERVSVPKNSDTIAINSLVISGHERYTRAYIKGKLKLVTPVVTTYNKLNEGINNLSATGNFDRVNHRLIDNKEGKELILNVKESENKMLLRFALHYDDLYQTAALVNVTRKSLLVDNDVLSVDVALGDNIRYNVDYYIDKGFYWSTGLKARYTNFKKAIDFDFLGEFGEIPANLGINTIDIDYSDFNVQAYAETLLRQTFSVGLGAEYKHLEIISETFGEDENQVPRTVFDDSDYWSAFGYIKLDTYNHKYFPKKGVLFEGDIHTYLFSSDFTNTFDEFSIAKAHLGVATPLYKKLSMNIGMEAGTKIGNTPFNSLNFLLGGFGAKTINNFIPFYGYDFLGITGESFAKAYVSLDYELFKKNHINVSANFANVGNKLFSTGRWFEDPEYTGYALGYGLDTFAGPLQVKYTYSPEIDESNLFFSIGFWF